MNIKDLSVDPSSHEKLKQELKQAKERNQHLMAVNRRLIEDLHGTEKARRLVITKPKKSKASKEWIRVIIPDSHGSHIDKEAAAAFLNDLSALNPREIVMLGDHVDCGGFLAQHHVLGYVAEIHTTSYHQDCAAANDFLDEIMKRAPNAEIHYIEGNHEKRFETWAVTTSLRHPQDAEDLRRAFAPEFRLHLAERGIKYYRRSEFYHGLNIPGAIKLGKCHFVHGISIAKNAAAVHVSRFAGNVVYGDTHRGDWCPTRLVNVGIVAAWNPGCLCYDEETYLLTDRGFIKFAQLKESDRVAEFDPWTKSLVYRKPIAYQTFDYDGPMMRFESDTVDLLVTPEHRMLLTKDNKIFEKPAADVVKDKNYYKVPLSGVFVGENTGVSVDQAKLVGWIISKGSIDTSEFTFRLSVRYKNKSQLSKIRTLLRRMGLKFSRHVDPKTKVTSLKICAEDSKTLMENFFENGGIRRISRKILSSPQHVLKGIFETLIEEDAGCYTTTSELLAEDFQELAHKIGQACLIKKLTQAKNEVVYKCLLRKSNTGDLSNLKSPNKKLVQYTGKVYDITTGTGFFMVKRNGKVSISGNCKLQPLWNETKPTDWSHGYAIQLVRQDGDFLHVQVPIINGVSLLGPMVNKITEKV
jgi:DNA-binding transcriptional regulator WhiA